MTFRFRCWHQGWAGPKPGGCGRTCDGRPAAGSTPAAVWFAYSPDRKGEHPQFHLSNFTGVLQADGYAGFDQIYAAGRIQEAACWAHVRRKLYDLEVAHKSPVAAEVLECIAESYAIEKKSEAVHPAHAALIASVS